MTWHRVAAIAAVALALALAPAFAEPGGSRPAAPAARFAIVIGNNRPPNPRAETLRFADDDALAVHQLLVAAGVASVLLTRLDDTTAKLHPDAVTSGLPRWTDLGAAFDRLEREMQRERLAGRTVELLVFYSGHGDVEHGEGFVVLEDQRLTRRRLVELLERSPATRNHVIIDACKSYFLAFEKGAGGRRTRFSGNLIVPDELSAKRLANTGFVLSTSSDRDSHEWERFGGGVFSHEVRSALLGAADVDRDGSISYAELGAFLATASQAVTNPRFRPDFLVRPPGGLARDLSATLLRWDVPAHSAVVIDQAVGHVYVETAAGERVLDAHPAPREELVLRVPASRPLFVRHDDGSDREYVLDAEGPVRVSELTARPISVGRRGAAQLAFADLFSVPFGSSSVRDYSAAWPGAPRAGAEVGDTLDAQAAGGSGARLGAIAGITALASGGLALATSAVFAERYVRGQSASQVERVRINRTLRGLAIGTGVLASVAVAAGAVWFGLRDRTPSRDDELALTILPTAGDPAFGVGVTLGRAW
jgi:hypothetical protein